MRILNHPPVLLLLAGSFLGVNFPLGRIAGDAGVSPILWSMLISLGVLVTLGPVIAIGGGLRWPGWHVLRYALISGGISFVAVNLLVFAAIPHVGAGFTGLMFALSPVATAALSALVGLGVPGRRGLVGIGLGFAGATLIAVTRAGAGGGDPLWMLGVLAIPLVLAAGNVYRSTAWPEGARPDALAIWSHGSALVIYLAVILILRPEGASPDVLGQVPGAALAQLIVAGLTFPVYFRLQQAGGPVMLSQIGYVAAAVGLAAATLVLGEHYAWPTWAGAGVIALGIVLSTSDRRRSGGPRPPRPLGKRGRSAYTRA